MTEPVPPVHLYGPSVRLSGGPRERDLPLRAKSVCLLERPRSKYGRAVRSADPNRARFPDKQYYPHRPQSSDPKRRPKPKVIVKQQNRKVVEKIPCAVSVQTLSIPMKYADTPKHRHSTSKPPENLNEPPIDSNKTKHNNPPKQVGDNKRLCHAARRGKETENKLLLQISEAEQVSDFERILNSNAILCERSRKHVWRGCVAAHSSASVIPRPRSAYSLYAVSQAYHCLFRQHEESLQPLIDDYRQTVTEQAKQPPGSLLDNDWYDNLQDLSEFYEDDFELRKEVETITDRIITEEIKSTGQQQSTRSKNFNVNLADLISLHVTGEGCSPSRDDLGPSPEVDRGEDVEWLSPSMSANSEHQANTPSDTSVECLAQNLDTVKIDSDAKVPTITFSNCSEGCVVGQLPNNTDVALHLAVPAVDNLDEARPPMM